MIVRGGGGGSGRRGSRGVGEPVHEALFQLVWKRNREMKMEWFDFVSEQVHPF